MDNSAIHTLLICITASNYEGGEMNNWLIDNYVFLIFHIKYDTICFNYIEGEK